MRYMQRTGAHGKKPMTRGKENKGREPENNEEILRRASVGQDQEVRRPDPSSSIDRPTSKPSRKKESNNNRRLPRPSLKSDGSKPKLTQKKQLFLQISYETGRKHFTFPLKYRVPHQEFALTGTTLHRCKTPTDVKLPPM